MLKDRIWGPASRLWAWIRRKWSIAKRGGAIAIICAWVALIAYSAWVNTFDATGFGLLDDDDRLFWAKFGPISALLLVLTKSLWNAAKSDGSLNHITVTDLDKTDVKQMAKYMNEADSVVIYSGDFSYIYDYEPLYRILKELCNSENLALISYKTRETVLERSDASRGDKDCLIQNLINKKKISFDVPGKAKFSLVHKRGEEVLLYRHREEETEYVTVFKANNAMAKQLVRTVNVLVETVVRAHPAK